MKRRQKPTSGKTPLKVLPCKSRKCAGDGYALLSDGSPYWIGASPATFPFPIYCARCKRRSTLTAAEWNRLPYLSLTQLDEFGLTDHVAKDWIGQGFSVEQSRELLAAGLVASSPELFAEPNE